MHYRWFLILMCVLTSVRAFAAEAPAQTSDSGIKHSFLVCGDLTAIIGEDNSTVFKAPYGTRDGFVLASGNLLLAVNKSKEFPGGGIVEMTREGKVGLLLERNAIGSEQREDVGGGHIVTTEAGPKPRLLEIDREGKTIVEFPLQCQSTNSHMETRMTRKLANGDYLALHLLDFAVKEYTPEGKVVKEFKTPSDPKEAWPFTAIRLENGNTLITLTHSKMVIEVDKDGKEVWRLTNADLPTPLLSDPCGRSGWRMGIR